jgi:hypothetical protein
MSLALKSVMTALAAAAQTVLDSGRTAFSRPVEGVVSGDVVVGYPTDPLDISATYQRGMDRATVPLWRVCGLPQDESTQDAVSAAIAGASDLITAIEGYAGTWDSVSVMTVQVETLELVGLPPQVALRFNVDVIA